MKRTFRSIWSAALLCLALSLSCVYAHASHLRGTSVSWQPTSTPGTVEFTVLYSQAGSGTIGGSVSLPFSFGDGASDTVVATITSVNSAESYITASATFTHTYTAVGPFTAYYEQCCRVDTTTTGSSETLRMETLVSPFANPVNHPPVAVSPAILTVPIQATTTFTIFATDQDNDPIHFRLATPQEQYDATSTSCNTQPPPGLTINDSGVGTWDTTQITAAGCNYPAPVAGQIWPVQFMIEDLDGNGAVKSKVPVDVLLKFVAVTQPAPTLTFTPSGTINATSGMPVTFTASATNTTAGSRITLNAVGLPTGASATNVNQTLTQPISSVFTWTPTSAQVGTYVIVYTATNDTYEQSIGSVSIKVQNIQPPTLTCAASTTAQYNASTSFPLTVLDPQGDAVAVTWSVDGTPVRTDNVAASTNAGSLSLTQAFTTLGSHTVAVSATNSESQTSTCSTPVTVTAADQTITFGSLPSLSYGDANTTLAATATSGLPITYTATGSCSVSGNTLQVLRVGSCVVTANQAGNANYNAASPAPQSTNIAARALSVTAQNATRVYGAANPVFTGSIVGVVNNDAITAAYSTTATTTSPVGTYVITPSLAGAALSNYTVTSNNGTLTITKGAIAGIQVVSSASPVFLQTSIVFQATVTGTANQPTGSVTFTDATTSAVLGSSQLTNGVAQLQTSALAAGSHQITAIYSGDTDYSAATSASITQQVSDLNLNLKADTTGSTTQNIVPGGTASYVFTLTPEGVPAFPGDVSLTASGLPTGATYSFTPATVTKGSGATQVTLTVKVPAATAKLEGQPLSRKYAPMMAVLLLLPFSGSVRKRAKRLSRLAAMLLLLVGGTLALAGLTGCGSQNGFLGQSEKTYTVTVTASTGAVSRSTTMQLIVQ